MDSARLWNAVAVIGAGLALFVWAAFRLAFLAARETKARRTIETRRQLVHGETPSPTSGSDLSLISNIHPSVISDEGQQDHA